MATIVEIEHSKMEGLSEYLEKMLKYGGKAMACLERLREEYEKEEEEEEGYERKRPRKKRSMKDYDEDEYLRYY